MATRILTFHGLNATSNSLGATYYIEGDYTPVAVRIYAEKAPQGDTNIDIYDDGVSIFGNRTPLTYSTGRTDDPTVTAAVLSAGLNSEEHAEDFATDSEGTITIEKGSWVHCTLDGDGANNISVQLELYTGDEELTEEE